MVRQGRSRERLVAVTDGARKGSYAIVVARFYGDLAGRLVAGARRAFSEAGIDEDRIQIFDVPGAYELPLAAKSAAGSGRFAAVVCLGAVIRGETDHYDHVSEGAAAGILKAGLDTGVPCSFGVLTCDNREQAIERSGGDERDQGYNAARTAIHMAELVESLRS